MKKHWKYYISPVLLACILLAGLWYYRPVDLHTLSPGLEAETINVLIERFGDDAKDNQYRHFDVAADSPEGQAILSAMEDLPLRRPPTNLLLQILTPTATGRETQTGDYNFVVRVFDQSAGWVALQFFIDEWKYDTPNQAQYLPCHVKNGKALGRALGDILWEKAPESESSS